jgi:hypothetical protein
MVRSRSVLILIALFFAGFALVMVMQNNAAQRNSLMTATAIQATNDWVSTAIAQTATARAYTPTPTNDLSFQGEINLALTAFAQTATAKVYSTPPSEDAAMTATAIEATSIWVNTAVAQTMTARAYTHTPSATPTLTSLLDYLATGTAFQATFESVSTLLAQTTSPTPSVGQ